MSNVLTAGQIPTSCEHVTVYTGPCHRQPITHTLVGRLYQCEDDDNILVTNYICAECAVGWAGPHVLIIPLTEYEVKEAHLGIH